MADKATALTNLSLDSRFVVVAFTEVKEFVRLLNLKEETHL